MHDKVASFLRDNFMEDTTHWNEFARDRAHVGYLSNAALLRVYWFAQGLLETWVGSRLPKHLNGKKVEVVSRSCLFCVFRGWLMASGFAERRPGGAGSYGGLVSGMQRDAFPRDRVWRTGREMGKPSRRGGVS
jgi:hypothetical protein